MADTDTTSIKVLSGMVDVERDEDDNEVFILRGVLDPNSLGRLKVDDYQREQLGAPKIKKIMEGIRDRGVPDIVLGMRGDRVFERGAFMYLQDPVYIIDGYQRKTAALWLMDQPNDVRPRLGFKLHFNTDYKFEKALFSKLNLGQTKLSSNVTLRNLTDDNPAIGALYKLTRDDGFRLYNQVGWGQNMRKGDLISAVTYISVSAMLHSHAGPGRSNSAIELANGLAKIMEVVKKGSLTENVRRYFELLDRCWGLGQITYANRTTYIRRGFMVPLANVLSDHSAFWNGDLLEINVSQQNRLAKFPINDPSVMNLAASGGMSGSILSQLIVDHMDHGKRTGRLVPRRVLRDRPMDVYVPEEDGEG